MADSTSTRFILADGRIELEGSEAFVEKQIDLIRPHLEAILTRPKAGGTGTPSPKGGSPPNDPSAVGLAGFELLFAASENGVQILKELPGGNKAEKAVNAALLLTLANTLNGTDTTSFDEIREMCKTHGCLDSSNFAGTLKAEKDAFVFGGSARKITVKLTVPGRKRADALADTLKA